MSLASDKTLLSQHRVAGAWWQYEPYQEHRVFIDSHGIRRTEVRSMPSLGASFASQIKSPVPPEDHREDLGLKIQKIRDEKVRKACGMLPKSNLKVATLQTQEAPYVALHALSGYSFGMSSMLAEEIPPAAANLGIPCVLLADRFAMTGAVEFTKMCNKVGIRGLLGTTVEIPEGGDLVLVARSRQGWTELCRLLSSCHLDEPRLFPLATWERLARHTRHVLCLTGGATSHLNWLVGQDRLDDAAAFLDRLVDLYGRGHVFVQIEVSYLPYEHTINRRLLGLAERKGIRCVAGGPITHAQRAHFPALDVNNCVESLCLLDQSLERKERRTGNQPVGRHVPRRFLNAERCFHSPQEMNERFSEFPHLVEQTWRVAELCDLDVLPTRAALPQYCENEGEMLRSVIRNSKHLDSKQMQRGLRARVDMETNRIVTLGFAGHFLVAWDLCQWAKGQGIQLSARGSVVDSVVAFALGMSRINAFDHHLHFDRFLPADGTKRPDIDIDFEAARREDVRQYLRQRYGDAHVATVAAVGAYSTRGIVREVGKVMGLSEESISFLSKRVHGGISPERLESALERRPELRDSKVDKERYRWIFRLAERLTDLPRNMRAHSSGVIVTREPVTDFVPVQHSGAEEVAIIQWDKRSAKYYFDKFDLLCLRGQDVLGNTEKAIRGQVEGFQVENISWQDEETYRAMRAGQLIGIPQSASPAMRQAHIRLKTENLSDASLVQAGIRPGVGGAVKINELIARRRGKPYCFAHPTLEKILGHTYGIIVFQEQVDQLLQEFAGCSGGEAEEIRESIHKRRREGYASEIKQEIKARIMAQGFSDPLSEEVYAYISGFEGYGFAQGHALAFAEISIRCIWCQQNYPSEYFAALLNAQPAGYYGPATIANEARNRGVKILRPDVNFSDLVCSVESVVSDQDPKIRLPNAGIRIGLNYVYAIRDTLRAAIITQQLISPFLSLADFALRTQPNREELEILIKAGCFESIHANRRELLWGLPTAMEHAKFAMKGSLNMTVNEPTVPYGIADATEGQKALLDRRLIGIDIDQHLVAFERERIRSKGGLTSAEASQLPARTKGFVVGNPIRLRFPPTQSGKRVVFFDLEDETGLLNVTCFDATYLKYGAAIVCSPYVTVFGEAQDRDGHTAFLANRVLPFHPLLAKSLQEKEGLPLVSGDFLAT